MDEGRGLPRVTRSTPHDMIVDSGIIGCLNTDNTSQESEIEGIQV